MIQLFSPLLLVITGITLVIIHLRRGPFQFPWLVAASSSLAAFLSLVVLRLLYPFQQGMVTWNLQDPLDLSFKILWDEVSWAYSLVVAVLLLGALLTDIIRASESEWGEWTANLFIGGLTILGLFSGNLFTLLAMMAILDVTILFVQLSLQQEPGRIHRSIGGLATRTAGTGLIVLAALIGAGQTESFSIIVLLVLLGGYLLRLGILPSGWAEFDVKDRGRRLGTLLSSGPVALVMIFLSRLMVIQLPESQFNLVLGILVLPAIMVSLLWALRGDEIGNRALWIFGFGTLAVLAAFRGLPEATLAWGSALLMAGGSLFFYSWRERWTLVFPLVAVWGISGLALSATWDGAGLYSAPLPLLLLFFLLVQAAFMAGYLTSALVSGSVLEAPERWVRVLYPVGLALILVVWFLLAWLPWKGLEWLGANPIWPGFIATTGGLGIWLGIRRWGIPESVPILGTQIVSFGRWVLGLFREMMDLFSRFLGFLTVVVEGRGGVLWAILFLLLLISLLASLAV